MNDDFLHNHRRDPNAEFGAALYQQLLDADETLTPVVLPAKLKRPQIWLRLVAAVLLILAAGVVALQSSNHTISPNLAQIDTRLLLDDLPPITLDNAGQLIEVARLGKGRADSITYSPDGKTLAFSTSDGVACYDADLNSALRFLPTPFGGFSAYDGQRIAVIDTNAVRIWDAETGVQQALLSFDPGSALLVTQFSPDRRWFAAGGAINGEQGASLYVWDAATGVLHGKLITHAVSPIVTLAFSPDSTHIAVQTASGIGVYDLALTSRDTFEVTVNNNAHGLAFSPDGKTLAIAYQMGVDVWDVAARKVIQTIHIGTSDTTSIQRVTYSPDGSLLAIADLNYGIVVWDVHVGKFLRPPQHLSFWQDISNLSFSPDSRQLALIRDGKTIVVQNARTGQDIAQRIDYDGSIWDLSLNADNVTTAAYGADGIQLRNLVTGELLKPLDVGLNRISHLAFSPDGQSLAVSGFDFTSNSSGTLIGQGIKLFDWKTGSEIARFGSGLSDSALLNAFTFAPDHRLIAYDPNGSQPRVLWWDLDHPDQEHQLLPAMLLQAQELQLSRDGSVLATYGYAVAGQTHVFDTTSGEEMSVPGLDQYAPDRIALSPNGAQLALLTSAGSAAGRTLVVFDLKTKAFFLHPLASSESIYSIAFSPDGTLIAAAGFNNFMLFDASSGQPLYHNEDNLGGVNKLVFSSDGRYIVGSALDGFIRVWGVPPDDKP